MTKDRIWHNAGWCIGYLLGAVCIILMVILQIVGYSIGIIYSTLVMAIQMSTALIAIAFFGLARVWDWIIPGTGFIWWELGTLPLVISRRCNQHIQKFATKEE